MDSISDKCTELKQAYDSCFNKWLQEKFLQGDRDHDGACGELFSKYQVCLREAIKEVGLNLDDLMDDHLGTDQEKTEDPKDKEHRSDKEDKK
ncbi:TP53-regulated inhibitor of apoptosis 1 [Oopsacas minuta]|uniref:TP53-regulated inhibitor of apoptosis 1 n=1 Tax=Oopsacas minuta TaxID=111878 RepID=A0AAV7JPK5_9METZ|nr:TP53-regulated inhibitor of apoptosis 1 [Oopsacas minuta]